MCFLSENAVSVPSNGLGLPGMLFFFLSYLYRIILYLLEEPASPVLGSWEQERADPSSLWISSLGKLPVYLMATKHEE